MQPFYKSAVSLATRQNAKPALASCSSIFRREYSTTTEKINTMNNPNIQAFDTIPVVDLAKPTAEVAYELSSACRNVGFFYIKNHGVSEALLNETVCLARKFFELSEKEKEKVTNKQAITGGIRGYFRLNDEHLNIEEKLQNYKGDLKEGFDVGRNWKEEDFLERQSDLYGINVWPEAVGEEFRLTTEKYYAEMHELSCRLMKKIALSLCLEEHHFDNKIDRAASTLRYLHYPPQKQILNNKDNTTEMGCGAHSDYGLLTLLAQFSEGLQVRNVNGTWISAPPIPGTFVVNLGDMMNRWTNESYSSTIHRVINNSTKHRHSMPFFVNPNIDAVVETLSTTVSGSCPRRFEAATSEQILLNRYSDTFTHFHKESNEELIEKVI